MPTLSQLRRKVSHNTGDSIEVKSKTQKLKITPMKNISFLHRVTNFSDSGKSNSSGLTGYVNHDLREALQAEKRLGFDPQSTPKNKIWIVGKKASFSNLNGEMKGKLRDTIMQPMNKKMDFDPDRSKDIHKQQKTLAAIRTKFKKYKTDDPQERQFWDALADLEITPEQVQEAQDKWDNDFSHAKRFKQKQTQIATFAEGHENLAKLQDGVESRKGENLTTKVQAQLHKIPLANGINHTQVSVEDYNEYLQDFQSRNFPNYPIIATIGHVDERSVDPDHNNSGDHLHSYIDAKNSVTGKFDLLDAQLKWAENALDPKFVEDAKAYRDAQVLELQSRALEPGTMQHQMGQVMGQYRGRLWQEAVRQDINANLLNDKGLNVVYDYRTRAKRELVADASKPNPDRSFNRITHELEVNQKIKEQQKLELKKKKALEQKNKALATNANKGVKKIDSLKEEVTTQRVRAEINKHKAKAAQSTLNARIKEVNEAQVELDTKAKEINTAELQLGVIDTKVNKAKAEIGMLDLQRNEITNEIQNLGNKLDKLKEKIAGEVLGLSNKIIPFLNKFREERNKRTASDYHAKHLANDIGNTGLDFVSKIKHEVANNQDISIKQAEVIAKGIAEQTALEAVDKGLNAEHASQVKPKVRAKFKP